MFSRIDMLSPFIYHSKLGQILELSEQIEFLVEPDPSVGFGIETFVVAGLAD